MPAALLIDLDDTLIDDRGAMAAAVLQFRRSHSLAMHEDDAIVAERWDTVGRSLWRRLALGEVSFTEQRRMRLRETFSIALTDEEADSLFSEYVKDYEQCWALLPGAEEFLAATAHLPRVIVTNGHRPQAYKKISKLGLAPHFRAVVTPDDCGARKPDPKIFQYALELLGVNAADALMVGDNHESDIAPALALGMQAFHVSSTVVGRSIRDAASAAPRSTGAPTAGHHARSGGTRYIFASPGLAPRRWRPVSSNVRHQEKHRGPLLPRSALRCRCHATACDAVSVIPRYCCGAR